MPINKRKLRAAFRPLAEGLKALYDRPLIWLFPFYAAGICLGWQSGSGGGRAFLLLSAASALLLWLGPLFPARIFGKFQVVLLPLAALTLAWGLTAESLSPPDRPDHIINFTEESGHSELVILGAYVLEGSGGRPGQNYRLLLDCREILKAGDQGFESAVAVQGRARISVGGRLDLETGDYVRLPVILRPLHGFKNPGSDGFEKYWGAQGFWVGGFVKSPALVSSWPALGESSALSRWRSRVTAFIDSHVPAPAAGLLAAQLAGRRNMVDLESEEVFRALGLSHLLSVSGLHLGVCYAFCFLLLRLILKRVWPLLGLRIRVNIPAAGLALIPALFYAALVGAASPVVRSAVMIAAVVLALLALRRGDAWNILAAAAWILLLAEPFRLFTASFQLSFVATAAMLAVFTRRPGREIEEAKASSSFWCRPLDADLARQLYRRWRGQAEETESPRPFHKPSYFRQTLWAALAGTFGTAPLVVWHFGRLPLAGIWANFLFTAILSFFVLVPGLAAMALLPLSPQLAAWPLEAAGTVMNGLMPLLSALAEKAGPGRLLPAPGFFFFGAWYLAGWIWLRSPRPWRVRLPLAGLVLALGFLPGLLSGPGDKNVLRFTVLDVGQGSAIHLNLPDGSQMLVDGGGTYNFDPGEVLISPYLLRRGLDHLDVVALTHPDQDHLKGLVKITEFFRPREVWDAPWPKLSPLYERFDNLAAASRRPSLSELAAGRDFGPARVALLWPPPDYPWPERNPGGNWVNDQGLVLKVDWGEVSFLITGDIGPRTEKALVELYGPGLKSTVLMASHHGSRDSLSPEFLAATAPAWVLFSVGRHNSFGLPHPETLQRTLEAGAKTGRTDLEGALIFEAREKGGEVRLVRPEPSL